MNIIKQTLFYNWNLMRLIRLALGIILVVQAYQVHDIFPGLIGALLLFQALSNTGCCGVGNCIVPPVKRDIVHTDNTLFEEIKDKKS